MVEIIVVNGEMIMLECLVFDVCLVDDISVLWCFEVLVYYGGVDLNVLVCMCYDLIVVLLFVVV